MTENQENQEFEEFQELLNNNEFIEHFNAHDLEWCLQKYPSHMINILCLLMFYLREGMWDETSRWTPSKEELSIFIKHGFDINMNCEAFICDNGETTPLILACEYRNDELIKHLLELGVNVNLRDKNGYNGLESILMGHNITYPERITECEDTIKILMNANPKIILRKDVINELTPYYKNSKYIMNLFNNATIVN